MRCLTPHLFFHGSKLNYCILSEKSLYFNMCLKCAYNNHTYSVHSISDSTKCACSWAVRMRIWHANWKKVIFHIKSNQFHFLYFCQKFLYFSYLFSYLSSFVPFAIIFFPTWLVYKRSIRTRWRINSRTCRGKSYKFCKVVLAVLPSLTPQCKTKLSGYFWRIKFLSKSWRVRKRKSSSLISEPVYWGKRIF